MRGHTWLPLVGPKLEAKIKTKEAGGARVAQSVKCLTLGFSPGHNPMVHELVHEFKPCVGLCTDSVEPALESGSLSLSASPPLKINFKKINKNNTTYSIGLMTGNTGEALDIGPGTELANNKWWPLLLLFALQPFQNKDILGKAHLRCQKGQ